ncbi:SWIB/MDM2 domain-containing protein, partial [Obelidium mucronatum]
SASAAAKAPRKKPDAHTPKKRAAGASAGTGFSKPMVLSEPLELLMRAVKVPDDQESPTPPNLPNPDPNEPLLLSRPEVVKRLWIHIKARDLQDPSNKTTILCDPLMEAIFKVKKLGMFKMNKYLSQHLKSANDVFGVGNDQLERHAANTLSKSPGIRGNRARKSSDFVVDSDEDENADENENEDDDDDEDEEDVEDDADDDRHLDVDPSLSSKTKKKSKAVSKKRKPDQEDASNDYGSDLSDDPPRKKGKSVFSRPYNLSPELQAVVGSAEPIARHEAVKQIWAYIKTNDLQDPSDRRFILCDDNLLALFKQPRISGFSMNKFLGDHLYKI